MSASLERPDPVEKASSPEKALATESFSKEYKDFLETSKFSVAITDTSDLRHTNPSRSNDSVTGDALDFKPVKSTSDGQHIDIPADIYRSESPGNYEGGRNQISDNLADRPQRGNYRDENNPLVFSGNDAIGLISRRAVGHSIWQQSQYRDYLEGGKLADAASVSLVLKSVGYDYADSANTNNLVKKLVTNGWQLVGLSQAKEGDVIFGGKLGTRWNQDSRNAHVGIVGGDGVVYHNDAGTGKWTGVARDAAFAPEQYGDQVFVLRPPLDPPQPSRDSTREGGPGNEGYARRDFRDQFRRDIDDGNGSYIYKPDQRDWQRYEDRRNSPDSSNGSDYWKQYWSDYWRDYWQEYYRGGDRNNGRPTDNSYRGPEGNSLEKGQRIYDAARNSVGRRMWQQSDYAPDAADGRLGSTPSISEVLQAAGFEYANAGRVSTLARQLLSRGWQPVSLNDLRPGDIIYGGKNDRWEEGGGNANAAIVGANGRVFHNDRNTGTWAEVHVGDAFPPQEYGQRIWALRPPDREVYIPPQRDEYAYRDYPDGNPRGYDRDYRPRGDYPGNSSLADIAANSVGRQLWRFIRGTPANLGCASSVSAVLNAGGYDYARSAGVGGLEGQLLSNGWRKMQVSEAQPGDVVIGARTPYYARGGGGSHIGVVGRNGKVYHNSSGQARWIETSLSGYYNTSRFRAGVWILRPPGQTA